MLNAVIEKKANALIKDSHLNGLCVNLAKVAQDLDIEIKYGNLQEELSGVLVLKNDKSVIGVNEDQSPKRQRFTIAHEIGHFMLHKGLKTTFIDEQIVFTRGSAKGHQEIEANAFAAALLMPSRLIKKYLKTKNVKFISESNIEQLSKEFEVSEIAMTYRLKNLNLI